VIEFLERLFVSAAPIAIASIGALFACLAGVLGIFIEGFMNAGAFFAWIIADRTGSVFLSLVITAFAAALLGWGLARFVRKTGANPFITGIAVNVASAGITDALSVLWFGTKGVLRSPEFITPVYNQAVIFSWFIVIAAVFLIKHTHWGLKLRASGISPEAAKERGVRPGLYWEASWAISACLAAIAGAFICFRVGAYTPGGIAGRGWISLAAVFLGFRHAAGVYIAALVFGLAEMAGRHIQSIAGLSATAFLGLPNALALILYIVSRWVMKRNIN